MEKVKFVNGIVENEIINHNKQTANGLTNTEMYRTANKKCYETFWFSVKGLATKGNPFVKANDYTVAYLDSWTTDTIEHYVKINGKWYYATEKQVDMMFNNVLTDDKMKCKMGNYHFYIIYNEHLEEDVANFVEDTREGDYIKMGNMGLNDEKDVAWYVKRVGVWVPCKNPKKSPLSYLASAMKKFEKEIVCEVNGATIKAFWEKESDGSGVYIMECWEGNEHRGGCDMDWDCETFGLYWGWNDEYKEETPKRFVDILNELETLLKQ